MTRTVFPILLLALLIIPSFVQAKETSQTFLVNQDMNYFWNRWNGNPNINNQPEATVIQQSNQSGGAGWTPALTNPTVTILYRANIINDATGVAITDGANVPVGTVLRLEFEPHLSTDISWFGTGHSMDSPYGEWRAGAAPPALTLKSYGGSASGYLPSCDAKDFVNRDNPFNIPLDIYIPLVVNPPTKSITTSANLTCDAADPATGNRRCTVNAAGPISVSFDFAATYGKFYYRYIDYRNVDGAPAWAYYPGCYGNNVALRPAGTTYIQQAAPVCWNECQQTTCVPPPDYFEYGDSGNYTGGGAGGGCFSGDTMVAMADGTQKPIAEVAIGDWVVSEDPSTGERGTSIVTAHLIHDGDYEMLLINDHLVVTPEHEIKIGRYGVEVWVTAGDIKVGDVLLALDGSETPVTSITAGPTLPRVYNLTTVPHHTYFAGGVLVHNIKGDGFYDSDQIQR